MRSLHEDDDMIVVSDEESEDDEVIAGPERCAVGPSVMNLERPLFVRSWVTD